MSLTDLMSGMDLTLFPQVALVIFLLVFLSIVWRLFRRDAAARHRVRTMSQLPLQDD